jgi:putative ABC transport system ATP-binding protein
VPIELRGIRKRYRIGNRPVPVLNGIDLDIGSNEFLALMGPSGSGKSTLLHILGCLDRPDAGTYFLDGANVFEASDAELSRFRANHIGFVFQNFHLIPVLTVFDNVALPFLYSRGIPKAEKRDRVREALRKVGLEHRIEHKPMELSGGEMQRVAIARAMVMGPRLILADEPTGNLDSETGEEIIRLFRIFHEEGAAVVIITHDADIASHARRRLSMKDGRIIDARIQMARNPFRVASESSSA